MIRIRLPPPPSLLPFFKIAERLHCAKHAFVACDDDDLVVRQLAEAHVLRERTQMPAVHTNCEGSRRRFVVVFRAQCGVESFPAIRTTRLRDSRVEQSRDSVCDHRTSAKNIFRPCGCLR